MERKVNVEVKLSKNYNTITIGISDEPIKADTEEQFNDSVSALIKQLRETIAKELVAIAQLERAAR